MALGGTWLFLMGQRGSIDAKLTHLHHIHQTYVVLLRPWESHKNFPTDEGFFLIFELPEIHLRLFSPLVHPSTNCSIHKLFKGSVFYLFNSTFLRFGD